MLEHLVRMLPSNFNISFDYRSSTKKVEEDLNIIESCRERERETKKLLLFVDVLPKRSEGKLLEAISMCCHDIRFAGAIR